MKVVHSKSELRAARAELPGSVGFVPTMGALHAGHMALVAAARAGSDSVVASIFVNPTQFGNAQDLAKYPDLLEQDLAQLRAAGCDLVFVPEASEMYAGGDTIVETPRLAGMLMGALRPGHFRGVATVVTKLFNLVRPDAAWFGEKDFQQVLVIRQIVEDLDMGLRIEAHPTVREADGLAMSSRNLRRVPEDRAAAVVLHQALVHAQALAGQGASATRIRRETRAVIAAERRADLKSLDLRDAATLGVIPSGRLQVPAVMLLAADFGGILLIDNAVLSPGRRDKPRPT